MDFMRKVFLAIASVFALTAANAQSGKNQVSIGAELGLPTTSGYKLGFGGTAKYLHGIGDAGQITLTAGYESYGVKGGGATVSTIPILAGYRHNFSGVYIEPAIGYGSQTVKIDGFGSASGGGFAYAASVGYAMEQGLDLSARYQAISNGGTFGAILFRVAYNFSLGGK